MNGWEITMLLMTVFAGLVFLVHSGDVPSATIETFVGALVGGGVAHVAHVLSGGNEK